MAIHSELSIAKKKNTLKWLLTVTVISQKKKKKPVKMAICSQLSLAKKR